MEMARQIEAALRAAWPSALARLVRVAGSLHEAEDCLQDAAAAAVEHWPEEGVPESPAAWLFAAARNRHFDQLRHRRVAMENAHLAIEPDRHAAEQIEPGGHALLARDDLLRLVFVC